MTWASCLLWPTRPSVQSRWRRPWQLVRNSLIAYTTVLYRSCPLCKKAVTPVLFPALQNVTRFVFLCPSLFLFLERGKTLVQRKPTMYPAWKACFDAHIYEGRVLEVLLMKTAEEPLAEVTVGVSVLAERCKKANGRAEFWVGHYRLSSFPLGLQLRLSLCNFVSNCVFRWISIPLGKWWWQCSIF